MMIRFPSGARVLAASALAGVVLMGVAACSGAGSGRAGSATTRAPAAEQPPALTDAQARAALVSEADLGGPWVPSRGAATWRDGLLKATTGDADCRRLLDALYADDLLGTPDGPRAAVALDDVDTAAQLRYQVTARRAADLDRTLDWLGTLPGKCGHFAATNVRGEGTEVRVTEVPLPEAGDARRGLRVTLTGADADGEPVVLTLEAATVRVGDAAICVTNGGLGDVASDVTRAVTQIGAHRLTEARKQGRALV